MNKFHKILSTLTLSFVALLPLASPADAISFTLEWEGLGDPDTTIGYSLTGTFTAEDLDDDGFIRATFLDFSEVTDFAVSFEKDHNTNIVEYNFSEITNDPKFAFNFNIGERKILQDGSEGSSNALSIGVTTPLLERLSLSLNSFDVDVTGQLSLKDIDFTEQAKGGEITAVPFEFEASGGILMLGAAWVLRKKLQKKTVND